MAGIDSIKDATDNLIKWWKQDKVSGTIMPIFLSLNIVILWKNEDWTTTQLIADAFMLALMVWSIFQYRVNAMFETRLSMEKSKYVEVEKERINLSRDEFEHRREMELFAKSIVDVEHKEKMALIVERADFVDAQIMSKVDHIIFLTENFAIDDKMARVIEKHKQEISDLREFKRSLPDRVDQRYRVLEGLEPPSVSTTGEIVKDELSAVLGQIKENIEVSETLSEISSVPST